MCGFVSRPFYLLRTMIEQAPIIFAPSLKSVIWGGSRICSYKGIPQPDAKIGESWEVSALPGHESVVESGPYAGSKLSELVAAFGAELLGAAVAERYGGKFPLLVKFLDVCHNISVQVHPRDELAMARHNAPGKNEMWYIVDSDPGAKVCVGFNQKISHDDTPSWLKTPPLRRVPLWAPPLTAARIGASPWWPAESP